ncbi:hypothetical protein NM688_g7849 [Phlebia brevispora]|uniref:Uncharacterized protein n=1 Tax=Phlebia brevispora TaxID=194682 RepID=A0ACC1S0K9_9APHY|nr:hypothetical protein NM688_g7849 [Phlebia brevispora]
MSDRGYFNLLAHLTRSTTSLPLSTAQAAVTHYLAHVQPTPTPLAASVISSAYFRSTSYAKLDALQTAFRHAVHLKVKLLKDEKRGLFTLGLSARTATWIYEVLKGLEGGAALLRFGCASGLLLGLEDWEDELTARNSRMRRRVEEELVIALAEVMDFHTEPNSAWEREFASDTEGTSFASIYIVLGIETHCTEMLSDALLIAARSLPLVDMRRLSALPLAPLTHLLLSTIGNAFDSGTFLSSLPDSLRRTSNGKVTLLPNSPFDAKLRELSTSQLVSSMAPLSAMYVQLLSALADAKPRDAWSVMADTLQRLDALTSLVEADWLRSSLAEIAPSDDDAIDADAKERVMVMWTILKTLLFTTIRLLQATLSLVISVPQPDMFSTSRNTSSTDRSTATSPSGLALTSLRILSHISFILPQFGGVTSIGTTDGGSGFPELKRAFYTALDVLSADPVESARFVRESRETFDATSDLAGSSRTSDWPARFVAAKKAYALACVEQLVPVLNDYNVQTDVYPLCAPYVDFLLSSSTRANIEHLPFGSPGLLLSINSRTSN